MSFSYNYYTIIKDVVASEDASLFPPRFTVNVKKKPNCSADWNTNIMITLHKPEEKSMKPIPFNLLFQS